MNEKLKQLLVRLIRHLDLEKRSALIAVNGVGVVLAGNVNATGATILEALAGDKKEVSADVCSLFLGVSATLYANSQEFKDGFNQLVAQIITSHEEDLTKN